MHTRPSQVLWAYRHYTYNSLCCIQGVNYCQKPFSKEMTNTLYLPSERNVHAKSRTGSRGLGNTKQRCLMWLHANFWIGNRRANGSSDCSCGYATSRPKPAFMQQAYKSLHNVPKKLLTLDKKWGQTWPHVQKVLVTEVNADESCFVNPCFSW